MATLTTEALVDGPGEPACAAVPKETTLPGASGAPRAGEVEVAKPTPAVMGTKATNARLRRRQRKAERRSCRILPAGRLEGKRGVTRA